MKKINKLKNANIIFCDENNNIVDALENKKNEAMILIK